MRTEEKRANFTQYPVLKIYGNNRLCESKAFGGKIVNTKLV